MPECSVCGNPAIVKCKNCKVAVCLYHLEEYYRMTTILEWYILCGHGLEYEKAFVGHEFEVVE